MGFIRAQPLNSPIAINQTLTGSFANMGPIIGVNQFNTLTLYIDLDINNSTDVQFKALAKLYNSPNLYELPIYTTSASKVTVLPSVIEIDSDVDQRIVIAWEIDCGVETVQLQTRAVVPGASPGIILSAKAVLGVR